MYIEALWQEQIDPPEREFSFNFRSRRTRNYMEMVLFLLQR